MISLESQKIKGHIQKKNFIGVMTSNCISKQSKDFFKRKNIIFS